MKPIFERVLFGRRPVRPSGGSSVNSTLTSRDIEAYYLRVIGNCLKRLLVKEEDVQIGVKRTGTAPSGLSSFAGYVRILRWDPVVTPVVLQNLSVIDARIRKVVRASVLLEHTHFDGLWFQATCATQGAPTTLMGLPAELKYQTRPGML